MPLLSFNQASLDEILEVRGEPLLENELWAVLYETGKALINVLSKTQYEKLKHLALTLTPETILLCLDGQVKFAITKKVEINKKFSAPECLLLSNSGNVKSKSRLEKMLVYSLGVSLLNSAEYGLKSSVKLYMSSALENLLCCMIKDDQVSRISLNELLQKLNSQVNVLQCGTTVCALTEEIVGPFGLKPLDSTSLLKLRSSVLFGENDKFNVHPFDPGTFEDEKYSLNSHFKSLNNLTPVLNENGKVLSLKEFDMMADESNFNNFQKALQTSPPIKKSLTPRLILPLAHESSVQSVVSDAPLLSRVTISSRKGSLNKAWSPSYSNPDFKNLVKLEKQKLIESGYSVDVPQMISPRTICQSMPALHNAFEEVQENEDCFNGELRRCESLQDIETRNQTMITHKSNNYSRASINSQTSHYSSQASLTHGAYLLDSEQASWVNDDQFNRYPSGSFTSQFSNPNLLSFPRLQLNYKSTDMRNFGPEFVRIAADPENAFIDISPPRLGPLSKGTRNIYVILPNTQKVKTLVQVVSKGKELFEQIALYMGVKETLYFGLSQLKEEEHVFIDLDVKLSKYSPTGWKDENPKKRKSDYVLYFKVKFFVETPKMLKQSLSTHLYYLQLRQELLQGNTHCPDDVAILLAGYALQAEYGAYRTEFVNSEYFNIDMYLPIRLLKRRNRMELFHNVSCNHKKHDMMSQEDAESGFIEEAKLLPEYGVLFYRVSRSKKIESDIVWLGVCIRGIVIVEPKAARATVHKQAWHLIKEFHFEKKKFIIKPKTDNYSKLVFYTRHYRRSKYLFRICQSFHRFQMFSQTHATIQEPIKEVTPTKQFLTVPLSLNDTDDKIVMNLTKLPTQSWGFTIEGGEDSNRLSQGVFIKSIQVNGVCAKDGQLSVGDRILRVGDVSLETMSHKEAVNLLKSCRTSVQFVVSKSSNANNCLLDKSGLSPNVDYVQLIRDDQKEWQANTPLCKDDVHTQLEGVRTVDGTEEDYYSERCVDDYKRQISTKAHPNKAPPATKTLHLPVSNKNIVEDLQCMNVLVNDNHVDNQYSESSVDSDTEFLLQSAGHMTLKRSTGFEGLNKIGSSDEEKNLKQLNGEEHDFEDLPSDTWMDESDENGFTVIVNKDKGSYGISIMGGVDTNLPLGGIYIQALQKKGTAYKTGAMKVGDHILSVNEVSLENVTHKEAVEVLKRTPDTTSFVLRRIASLFENNVLSQQLQKDHVFEVELQKQANGLGLSLVGGADGDVVYNGQFMIKKLFPGQPMEQCGKFQKGDVILAINDQVLDGLNLAQVVSILRSIPNNVSIIAKRPDVADLPKELFVSSRPVSPEKILSDLKTKEFHTDGRQSQEGHRIAKQLMKSMVYTQRDVSHQSDSSRIVSDRYEIFDNDIDQKLRIEAVDKLFETDSLNADHHLIEQSRTSKSQSSSGDFDTPLGFPRHRPSQSRRDGKNEKEMETFYLIKDQHGKHGLVFGIINGELSVKSVKPNSPAQRQKVFKTGLVVYRINDVSVSNMSVENVNKFIDNSSSRLEFQVHVPSVVCEFEKSSTENINDSIKMVQLPTSTSRSLPSSPLLKNLNPMSRSNSNDANEIRFKKNSNASPTTGELILVQLEKGTQGLGITLGTQASNDSKYVFIKNIVNGGLADENGKLSVGDRIVSVNGRNVEEKSQKEVVAIFRVVSGTVAIECFRPPYSPQFVNADTNAVPLLLPQLPSIKSDERSGKKQSLSEEVGMKELIGQSVTPRYNDAFHQFEMVDTSSPALQQFNKPSTEEHFNRQQSTLFNGDDAVFNLSECTSFADTIKNSDLDECLPIDMAGMRATIDNLAASDIDMSQTKTSEFSQSHATSSANTSEDEFGFSESEIFSLPEMDFDGVIRGSSTSSVNQIADDDAKNGVPHGIPNKSSIPILVTSNAKFAGRKNSSSISEHFIERRDFRFYTSCNINDKLNNIERKISSSEINTEFTSLRQMKINSSCDIGNRACNRDKNRNKNVLPFDWNRVKLTGGEESDYINATHLKIDLEGQCIHYIVSQAPLESTFADFWRSIWENKVEVIVMLVKPYESGKVKCYQYWPKVAKEPVNIIDRFEVELLYEEKHDSFTFRQLQIRNKKLDKSLFITHVSFNHWPDTGVPQDVISFLGFVKFAHSFENITSPVLVHCCGGVGRSGIFVLVDYVWHTLENDKNFDVFTVAKYVKQQRHQILQTKEQYLYIYVTIRELLKDMLL